MKNKSLYANEVNSVFTLTFHQQHDVLFDVLKVIL